MSTNTAGIVVVGDEILKGHTRDTNSGFLLSKLWSLGVKVEKVSVIPDNIDAIADEIAEFSSKYSVVITSGGIGPTHDDVTIGGIAKAFNEELEENKALINILSKLCEKEGIALNDSVSKMARVPKSARLHFRNETSAPNGEISFPLITVKNVYIFPGVPEYFEKSFSAFSHLFDTPETKRYLYKLYLTVDETKIAEVLTRTDAMFKDVVHLGSYPYVNEKSYKVKIIIESEDLNNAEDAYDYLVNELPRASICYAKKYSPNSRECFKEIFKPGAIRNRVISNAGGLCCFCIFLDGCSLFPNFQRNLGGVLLNIINFGRMHFREPIGGVACHKIKFIKTTPLHNKLFWQRL